MILVDASDLAIIERHGKILIQAIKVKKISLDLLSLVTQGENEFVETVLGIVLHDMPEDGLSSDWDHGFRAVFCLFAQPGS